MSNSDKTVIPRISVLSGGVGAEREVSLQSGQSLADALEELGPVDLIDLVDTKLPDELDPRSTIVFPIIHGTFGEDGALQALLEDAGFAFAGCDAASSRLCTRCSRRLVGRFNRRRGRAMFSAAVSVGRRWKNWNTEAIRVRRSSASSRSEASLMAKSPIVIRPRSIVSTPPRQLSRVLLPEPEGPMRATRSPLAICRSTPSNAATRFASPP